MRHDESNPIKPQPYMQPTLGVVNGQPIDPRILNAPPEIKDTVREGVKILSAYDMSKVQARVCAVIDISRSMENPNHFVSRGILQDLFNKFFSLGILFDDNQAIEVFLLGETGKEYPVYTVTKENYNNFISKIITTVGYADDTAYDAPIKQLLSQYFKEDERRLWSAEDPVFCAFLTDGEPNPEKSGRIMKRLISGAAAEGKPAFFKFLALDGPRCNFQLLQSIDDDKDRRFDNSDFISIRDPDRLGMKDLINEFRGFVLEMHKLGLLETAYDIPQKYLNAEDRVSAHLTTPDGRIVDLPQLESLYKKNSGGFFARCRIFGHGHNAQQAVDEMNVRAEKNSSGASAKTLNALGL